MSSLRDMDRFLRDISMDIRMACYEHIEKAGENVDVEVWISDTAAAIQDKTQSGGVESFCQEIQHLILKGKLQEYAEKLEEVLVSTQNTLFTKDELPDEISENSQPAEPDDNYKKTDIARQLFLHGLDKHVDFYLRKAWQHLETRQEETSAWPTIGVYIPAEYPMDCPRCNNAMIVTSTESNRICNCGKCRARISLQDQLVDMLRNHLLRLFTTSFGLALISAPNEELYIPFPPKEGEKHGRGLLASELRKPQKKSEKPGGNPYKPIDLLTWYTLDRIFQHGQSIPEQLQPNLSAKDVAEFQRIVRELVMAISKMHISSAGRNVEQLKQEVDSQSFDYIDPGTSRVHIKTAKEIIDGVEQKAKKPRKKSEE